MTLPLAWTSMQHDLAQSRRYARAILFMTLTDVRGRYRRSVLGPFWLTLGTSIGAMALAFIWAELMHKDFHTFVPTLATGLILWQFIAGVLGESPGLFIRQSLLIRNLNLPLSIYPAQLLLRHLFNLAHYAPVYVVIVLWVGLPLNANTLLVLPGILLAALNLLWISLLIGMLGARFRDIEYLITMSMPLLMLLSPVFYRPDFLPFSEGLVWLNPIAHLIEVVRNPLLGLPVPAFVIWTNLALLTLGGSAALWLFRRKRHRIAFWV